LKLFQRQGDSSAIPGGQMLENLHSLYHKDREGTGKKESKTDPYRIFISPFSNKVFRRLLKVKNDEPHDEHEECQSAARVLGY
jgi:hypothetical protein